MAYLLYPIRMIAEFFWWFLSSLKVVFWSGSQPGFIFWTVVILLFAVLAGSAYLAAIAEMAGKNRNEAFWTGLVGFWVYPRSLAAESEVAPTQEEIEAREAEELHASYEAVEEEPEEIDGWCKGWFSVLPAEDDGVRYGPFTVTLLNGNVLEINSIRELRDDLMIVENAATGKSLRVRYDTIANFEGEGLDEYFEDSGDGAEEYSEESGDEAEASDGATE